MFELDMTWLKKKVPPASASQAPKISGDTYVDLLPNENADADAIYASALDYALKHPRIRNIAITGPYGSGKSSVIASFAKRNQRYTFLNLSLASFNEADSSAVDVDRQIERSILQQMLYGVEASRLPFSRFKRITVARHALPKAALIFVWGSVATSLYLNSSFLPFPSLLTESFSLSLLAMLLLAFLVAVPIVLLADIYRASAGFSIKKISLTNAEIEGGEFSEVSILNRHIDEIIYFFNEVKCDAVVIEDLDRFGSPEIFIKLREINKLINDGRGGRKSVKFLYALKDDMFAHRSRAKFFDFIIPIIPVISSANSLEKIHERIRGTAFDGRIDNNFLFEASVYLDDLRCIHNIFNEYAVYYAQLPSETLDATKLLAMIVYKNVYPDDFEALHYGKGILFNACASRTNIIENKRTKYAERLTQLKALLKGAEEEHLGSVDELIQVYCAHIFRKSEHGVTGIAIGQVTFRIFHPIPFESFMPIVSESTIRLEVEHNYYSNQRRIVNLGMSFADIQDEVNFGVTFLERKEQIDAKGKENRARIESEIKELEQKIVGLPNVKMCELLREEGGGVRWDSTDSVKADTRLLRYLVNNGYIDDTYYLYTASFYAGSLTLNDHAFIVAVRDFRVLPPEQKVDTPREVCRRMRPTDFHQKYVLNISIFDYLLDPTTTLPSEVDAAVFVIRDDFSGAETFLGSYYSSGKHIDRFFVSVASRWPQFGAEALGSTLAAESLRNILKYVNPTTIVTTMNEGGVLTEYLSHHCDSVFASNLVPPKTYDALKGLEVRLSNVESLAENRECVEFVQRNNLYQINAKNVLYLMRRGSEQGFLNIKLHEQQNLTCIFSAKDSSIADFVRANIDEYVSNVFLTLVNNTKESEATIVYLLKSRELSDAQKKQVLRKEEHVFDDLKNVDPSAWSIIFDEGKIAPSWDNIGAYFTSDQRSDEILIKYFQRKGIAGELANKTMDSPMLEESQVDELANFVVSSEALEEQVYSKLIASIPFSYGSFSGMPSSRFLILARLRTVRLTEESFTEAAKNAPVQAQLIARDFSSFASAPGNYIVTDDVRILLLSHDISPQEKIGISAGLSASRLKEDRKVAATVCAILLGASCDISKIGDDIAIEAVSNTSDTESALRLLTLFVPRWDETVIMDTLARMPEPVCEIASYGKRPKLRRNDVNVALAKALERKGAISSLRDEDGYLRINTWRSSDHAGASDS